MPNSAPMMQQARISRMVFIFIILICLGRDCLRHAHHLKPFHLCQHHKINTVKISFALFWRLSGSGSGSGSTRTQSESGRIRIPIQPTQSNSIPLPYVSALSMRRPTVCAQRNSIPHPTPLGHPPPPDPHPAPLPLPPETQQSQLIMCMTV